MTLAAVITAALALLVAAVALWVAVVARADALTCRRELSRHRKAHADQAEERRVNRLRPPQQPVTGTPTEQITAVGVDLEEQDPETAARPAVRLPRPGRSAR